MFRAMAPWALPDDSGRAVTALGPEHPCVGQPAYDRVTRREWVNPYSRPVRPVSLSPILEHQQRIMHGSWPMSAYVLFSGVRRLSYAPHAPIG
jgi:hypothetical protein